MAGQLEGDSHADIHCAGKNCVMLSATRLQCDVSLFHDSYMPKTDVEIVQSATAFQHNNGNVYYLIMTKSLWFGDDMEHSLFNGLIATDTGSTFVLTPTISVGIWVLPSTMMRSSHSSGSAIWWAVKPLSHRAMTSFAP
jgi:hypothetical protein